MQTPRKVFVPLVGQEDNIGDAILRRSLVCMLRPVGELHVYVGGVSRDFVEALGLTGRDVKYRTLLSWVRVMLSESTRGDVYVFKPGEVQFSLGGLKEPVGLLPVLAHLRRRGGKIARAGVGIRFDRNVFGRLHVPAANIADVSWWRDAVSASAFASANVAPDLAFAEGQAQPEAAASGIVVSLRGDRPLPSAVVLKGIHEYANESGAPLHVVTQVARDDSRSRELVEAWPGSQLLAWNGRGHRSHELALRQVYRRCGVAISDRLHVLIAAVTEGASPLTLTTAPDPKIDRHFVAAGMPGVVSSLASPSMESVKEAIRSAGASQRTRMKQLDEARARLAGLAKELSDPESW